MQQRYGLSDPATEDALYDSESMRRFAGIDFVENAIPGPFLNQKQGEVTRRRDEADEKRESMVFWD